MFIREVRTTRKNTGVTYVKHVLVESARVNGKPRQRILMELGKLDLPKIHWKRLAHALECQLTGQASLLEAHDAYIEDLALTLVSNCRLSAQVKVHDEQTDKPDSFVSADLHSMVTEQSRSLGQELVCQDAWDLLRFDIALKSCGFSQQQIDVAKTLIFGRLISPGSERHTIEWVRKRSALPELSGFDPASIGKDLFYDVGDLLYANKDELEKKLFFRQQSVFPYNGLTVFLYDLTNTYLEGSALHNTLAKYGHCKSKRFDCPLVAMSLMVRNDGVPVVSHIYRGNQGEPETLADVLQRLQVLFGYDRDQLALDKPTLIMDRGIATVDNIALLESQGYPYIVVTREDQREDYRALFENGRESFTLIDGRKRSAYGDLNNVYVKKIDSDNPAVCKVLCISDGKAHKEDAIISKKEEHFLEDIQKLEQSIIKGSIKNTIKIQERLDKICQRHKLTAMKYITELQVDQTGKVTGIQRTLQPGLPKTLSGCYVIESTHTELNELEIWHLYMTQTHVEKAFRAMKDELGIRPVYHQNAERTSAHLFISVLAYHLLSAIERRLAQKLDFRLWETIRDVLSTHTRNTISFKDTEGFIYHKRVTGKPEDVHHDIYRKLDIVVPTKPVVSRFK